MLRREEAVFETLRHIQCFFDDNGTTLGAMNDSTARRRLDGMVSQMADHAVAQIGGRRVAEGETARQRQLRLSLRFDYMRPIAIIAKQRLREQPEFTLLRLPRFKTRSESLIAAARDMANAAEKYTELFVEEGLTTDFAVELRAAADRLEQSINARGQGRGQRAGATAGLKLTTTRARALIQLLDSIVRPKLGADDELRRKWQVAKHIQRPRTPATSSSPDGEATSESAVSGPALVRTSPAA